MKIPVSAHKDIIEAYTIDLWPLQEIADVLHVSRTAVHKYLTKHGVDTSKHKIKVSCTTCGQTIERTRKRVRTQRNHFCSEGCYSAFLGVGKTLANSNRQGQRIARRVVSELFDLQPEHVVHHEDRNQMNNLPNNLKVFGNNGDHLRYHHANRDKYANSLTGKDPHRKAWERYHPYEITPVWDGSLP